MGVRWILITSSTSTSRFTSSLPSRSPRVVNPSLRLPRMMASSLRPASRLVARPFAASAVLRQAEQTPFFRSTITSTAQFHTSSRRNALPSGPPPSGYRLPKPKRFYEGEGVMDKASNYFLLTEMMRGMYIVMEQFFRPPYVHMSQWQF
jgi:hypothetical protein